MTSGDKTLREFLAAVRMFRQLRCTAIDVCGGEHLAVRDAALYSTDSHRIGRVIVPVRYRARAIASRLRRQCEPSLIGNELS